MKYEWGRRKSLYLEVGLGTRGGWGIIGFETITGSQLYNNKFMKFMLMPLLRREKSATRSADELQLLVLKDRRINGLTIP